MDHAIEFLAQQLNQHIKQAFGPSEDLVIVGRLTDGNGSIPEENRNKLILSLVNITADATQSFYNKPVGFANAAITESQPLFLNLDFLLTANFSNALETTKFLTAGIRFFHERPNFSTDSDPSFPSDLHKITLEMYNLSLKELDSLWSALNTSIIPSVLYKVRMIHTS